MMRTNFLIVLLCIMLVAFVGKAQPSFSLNKIPLGQDIDITLLGVDKELLNCYNMYGFQYFDGTDSIMGEFVVFKDQDMLQDKTHVKVRLCKIEKFSVMSPQGCRSMPTPEGIRINYRSGKEELYLNFDPEGPEPVFILCK